MQAQSPPMGAAIDIGSNTIHLVVACYSPDNLDIVADEVEMVRIGESVTASGDISKQKTDDTIALLQKYKAIAVQHKADPILVVATEAIRKAKNSADFLATVKRKTGLAVQLIDGNVEAVLTFYGATYELQNEPQAPQQVGVMDLGGGSTELVLAKQQQILWRTSVPIGSGWLHDRYLQTNPPTRDELSVAQTFLQTYFAGLPIKSNPPVLIVTGGSANSLLLLARQAFHLDGNTTRLTYDDLVRCEGLLSALSAEEIASRYNQPLKRAIILPAGALIIREAMTRLQAQEIRVSPHGIREGALLAYARYGEAWLERVEAEAKEQDKGAATSKSDAYSVPFALSGRPLLLDRTHKMLQWRSEVLKQEDIEPVHKMRVATRRLRAVLDAYEAACEPKVFKKVYRRVKDLADVLGSARDTDVMVQKLEQQLATVGSEEQAGYQWLIAHLKTYRQQQQQTIQEFFQDFDEKAFKAQIEACMPEKGVTRGKS